MPGHNHSPNCSCGWCFNLGSWKKPIYESQPHIPAFDTLRSFVDPNAICPVCSAPVFFYQSPSGGRVFFDELGPPWPKHPCTDNGRPVSSSPTPRSQILQKPGWYVDGWMPVSVERSKMDRSWHSIPVRALENDKRSWVLSEHAFFLSGEVCAAVSPWTADGFGTLSIIKLNEIATPRNIPVFRYEAFIHHSSYRVGIQRRKTTSY